MKDSVDYEERKALFEGVLKINKLTTEERKTIEDALRITEQEITHRYYQTRLGDAQRYLLAEHGLEESDYKYRLPPLFFNEVDPSNGDDDIPDAKFSWSLEDGEPEPTEINSKNLPPRVTLIEITWPLLNSDYKELVDHELGHWIDVQLHYDEVAEDPHGESWVRIMIEAFGRDESSYQDIIDSLDAKIAYLEA